MILGRENEWQNWIMNFLVAMGNFFLCFSFFTSFSFEIEPKKYKKPFQNKQTTNQSKQTFQIFFPN